MIFSRFTHSFRIIIPPFRQNKYARQKIFTIYTLLLDIRWYNRFSDKISLLRSLHISDHLIF
nr:MAG TPA: hypothetical protein [Caudoviricetes sp.]